MKFNPLTKTIYTDNDEFVKTMHCPVKMHWDQLVPTTATRRACTHCNHSIVDTKNLKDDELLSIIRQDPDACFKIDLNQQNLKIVTHGILEQK